MQASTDATSLTIIISTLIVLSLSLAIIYFLFLYQRKRFRHQQELMAMREEYHKTLHESQLAIQEQMLDQISKELHANVSHLVSLININLSEILPQSPTNQRESIIETKSLAKQLMAELKALSASLNTDHIKHIGFVKALENELNRVSKTKKYKINIIKNGEEYRMLAEHEFILFRLCQEVLNNIVKYSRATEVSTTFHFSPDHFALTITDNGIGFNVEEALNLRGEKQSTGLINMRKRATHIKAAFEINSELQKGTTVNIHIPYPEQHKLTNI